ncbi:MAG: hypothetical protein WBA97_17550 [Actinophytocola sp.]|uniref:hypothetical protein n=1 Tax=Actinophytocola sp. TaxID=1872138 RepID=UPI003C70D1A3
MKPLSTDQYTRLNHNCPMTVDMYPADDLVEVVLGEHRTGGDTLRPVIDHPDTVRQLSAALLDAGTELVEHLRTKANADAVM